MAVRQSILRFGPFDFDLGRYAMSSRSRFQDRWSDARGKKLLQAANDGVTVVAEDSPTGSSPHVAPSARSDRTVSISRALKAVSSCVARASFTTPYCPDGAPVRQIWRCASACSVVSAHD